MNPGQIIRERRLANRLTQKQLALRSGSTQAAISRLERGEVSPTFETFERLLLVMGEEGVVSVRRPAAHHNPARLRALRRRSPSDRFELALSWNRLAGQISQAGAKARDQSS